MTWAYTDTAGRTIEFDSCSDFTDDIHIRVQRPNVIICIPAHERREAAQALAGDEYRVVPARDSDDGWIAVQRTEYERLLDRDQYPRVRGTCPACGVGPLFLGEGGHVTCSWVDCKEPEAADETLQIGLTIAQPDRPDPVDPAGSDLELAALHQIVAAMNGLDRQQQARTVRYLSARYGDADSFMEQLTGHRMVRDAD